MSASRGTRASELAAQQVEEIVAAAQAVAEEIRKEAGRAARRDAEEELARARREAVGLGQDARRSAEAVLADAREESVQIRTRTKRSVEGRVAAAERAAAEVLEEARALSGGLHQLGKSLEDHADRILRDVQAAHKRMQADLRVGAGIVADDALGELVAADEEHASTEGARGAARSPRSAPARRAAASSGRGGTEPSEAGETPSRRARRNPFEEIEVPAWVEPEH